MNRSTQRAGTENTQVASSSEAAADQLAYEQLQCYTLEHGGPEFLHQHVVDAWAAQTADGRTKPIRLTFALIGLYLHVEKGFSGRRVQRAHMQLGKRKRDWPSFVLPQDRGPVDARQVMVAPPGPERDRAISAWCRSVWAAFSAAEPAIVALLKGQTIL